MKARALELAAAQAEPSAKLNIVREYIQACVLRSFHESEAFGSISFVGGTALRFLFELPRFSEDLDFSVENSGDYKPEKWLEKLKRDLIYQGFIPSISIRKKSPVHAVWIRFGEILQALSISAHADQKLSIKIEMDTRPPSGAVTEKHVLNRPFLFVLRHHDLPSLFAGKVYALLTRKYVKGRDWYDLMWYLSRDRSLSPNPDLLRDALKQTGHGHISEDDWKQAILERAADINWEELRDDIVPFLENNREAGLLTAEFFTDLLK